MKIPRRAFLKGMVAAAATLVVGGLAAEVAEAKPVVMECDFQEQERRLARSLLRDYDLEAIERLPAQRIAKAFRVPLALLGRERRSSLLSNPIYYYMEGH